MKIMQRTILLFETLMLIENFLTEAFDSEKFLSTLQSVATLARRAPTLSTGEEGERGASLEALQRMLKSAKEHAKSMTKNDGEQFLRKVQDIVDSGAKKEPEKPEFKKKLKAEFADGVWIYSFSQKKAGKIKIGDHRTERYIVGVPGQDSWAVRWDDARKATQEEIDAAMASSWSKEENKTKYAVGDWIYCFNRQKIGKILKVNSSTGMFQTYVIWAVNYRGVSSQDVVEDSEFRSATPEEKKLGEKYYQRDADRNAEARQRKNEDKEKNDVWKILEYARFKQGTSDKVYGVGIKGRQCLTFWGRFTGPYQTKDYSGAAQDAHKQFMSKISKGYVQITDQKYIDKALEILKNSI